MFLIREVEILKVKIKKIQKLLPIENFLTFEAVFAYERAKMVTCMPKNKRYSRSNSWNAEIINQIK